MIADADVSAEKIPGLTIYRPREASHRTSLVAFSVAGHDPLVLAQALNDRGVEARAGCHCAARPSWASTGPIGELSTELLSLQHTGRCGPGS